MIGYRRIELRDIQQLLALTEVFWKNSPTFRDIELSLDKMHDLFTNAVNMPDVVFCDVAVIDDDVVIGGFLGVKTAYFFSNEFLACDLGLFVYPEYRNTRTAVKLVDRFVDWSTRVGCREVNIGSTAQSAGPVYERMLHKRGFKTVGFVAKKLLIEG